MSNKVPQLRFNGYSDAWVQRNLGEVVDVKSGRDYKHLSEGDIPVYGTGGYMLSVDEALSQNDDAIGIGRKGTIDNPYLLRAPFWTVDTLFYAIPRVGFDLNFTFDIFQKVNWRKLDESTGVPSLSKATINSVSAAVPSEDEQIKIGGLFEKIDNLIAANQRKLDLLKEQKKGYLQKMFPKDGDKVPELRFAGFADDWEERKLSDMANVKTGFPFKNENFVDDGQYLVITNGNIQNDSAFVDGKVGNRITAVTDEIKEKYTLNYGDILVTMDGTVGRTAKVVEGNQILAQRVGRLVSESTPEFIYQWLNTGKFFTEMNKVSHGGTIKHISLSEIGDYVAYVPTSKDEREKIGSLFLNIDKTITLHQRKLDLLKEQKKGFLQKMFV
ncbi:restriction endonuclease subunit S [Weissella confusa]|uniref:restriction endonuclease subunit S n=1 Tax=Weissella confusa TaxID=1583 RepID=UPI0018F20D52|nr:restriction endonuclease subunit S [Weissella confusa]MBJ7648479.1 restriction endonuclease subunit S [Weissella confusa]